MVERLFKEIGTEVKIEDIKVVRGQREKGRGAWIVKLESEIQKKEIMEKISLRKRKEKVMDNLT